MKKISLFTSTLMGIAGNAPAYGVGVAAATMVAASGASAPIAVTICGIAMLGIMFAYRKLNEQDANCGAAYTWVGKIVHPIAGFLAGWSLLVALLLFMVSAILAAGQTVVELVGLDVNSNTGLVYGAGLAILGVVTVPALLGASVFGRFQTALTVIELLIVAAIFAAACLQFGDQIFQALTNLGSKDGSWSLHAIAKGIVVAVFFFWGWDVIFNLSEETVETEKTSGSAAFFSLGMLIAIYVSFTVVASALAGSDSSVETSSNLLIAISKKVFPAPYAELALLAFLISVVGSLDASIIQFSRTLLSKSRDGLISKKFAVLSPRFQVPTLSILFTVGTTLVLTLVSYFSGSVSESITAGVAGSAIFVAYYYGLAGIACAWNYYQNRPSKTAHYFLYIVWPAVASFGLVASAIFVATDFGILTYSVVASAFGIGICLAVFRKPFARQIGA